MYQYGVNDEWGMPGFDDPDRPKMSFSDFGGLFRSTKPEMGNVAPALGSVKADILAENFKMSGAPGLARGMGAVGSKVMPGIGAMYTGSQTYANNPANLNGAGRVLHGGATGLASLLTPAPIGIADAVSGNRMGNAIEDMTGAALRPWFGNADE